MFLGLLLELTFGKSLLLFLCLNKGLVICPFVCRKAGGIEALKLFSGAWL